MEEIMETWNEGVVKLGENAMRRRKNEITYIRQQQYADDSKRVFNWLIRENMPMCDIVAEEL
jgi:hypothetical protein